MRAQFGVLPARSHSTLPRPTGHPTACIVHPGALPLSVYSAISAALAPDMALDVLDLPGVPEYRKAMSGTGDVSIEELADLLIAELRAHRSIGSAVPVIAGWSFGGIVALAIADRLTATASGPVVLIDSVAPWVPTAQSHDRITPTAALEWFCMFLGARVGMLFEVAHERFRGTLNEALTYILESGVAQNVLPAGAELDWLREIFEEFVRGVRGNGRLQADYRPARPPGRLVLVKADRSMVQDVPALGWDELAGANLEIAPCPGNHYSLLTDPTSVARLAAVLRTVAGSPPREQAG